MRIQDLMQANVVRLQPEMSLQQAAAVIGGSGINGALILSKDRHLEGMITKSHLIDAMARGEFQKLLVKDVMTRRVFTLRYDMAILELQKKSEIYRYSLFPVEDDAGRIIGLVNRTDLVKYLSDSSLYQAGELETILDSLAGGVIVINQDGNVVLFNAAAEKITGLAAAEAVGRPVQDIMPNSGLLRVLETGISEFNRKQNVGNCQILTNRSPIFHGNKIAGAVAIFHDITELQTVAAELEDVKSLKSTLESAIESVFECIVVVDQDGKIKMLNRAYGEFLGIDPQEAVGKHVTEIIENTRMHVVAQNGKPEIMEAQYIKGDNRIVTRIPIIKDGETVGAVGRVLFKDVKDLKIMVNKFNQLQSELEYYKEELRKVQVSHYTVESIIGRSEKMEWLKSIAMKAARGAATVLIQGESGTGKELFAHSIHNGSLRRHGPFIKVNCAAVPENLLESELFGYEEGAFTGARKGGKPGKFELANGGTIFLDEIGDMTLAMQAKLLRVLQEREIERVGGTKSIKVDLRIVAATNRDLEGMVERGEFRQDLYYRLNVINLFIPALRERLEDIPQLCQMLLHKIKSQVRHSVEGVSPEVMQYFMAYKWPGNVRELENVLERAVNLMDDETMILPEHLPPQVKRVTLGRQSGEEGAALTNIMEETERQAIIKALEAADGNKTKAARILGIHRSGFYQKLQKYRINLEN